MKRCAKCGQNKSRTEFSARTISKDRLQQRCVKCRAEDRMRDKDRIKATNKEWRKNNPGWSTAVGKRYRERYPEKNRAQRIIEYAIRTGKIYRPDYCESCFKECVPDGHHEDYSKPFEVEWLCKLCHTKLHEQISC